MKTPRIALMRISLATFIILVVIALPSLYGRNNIIYALGSSGQASSDCSITLNVKGSGQVTVIRSDSQPMALAQVSAQVQLPCGDEVTLKAQPAAYWRFDHWQGVPGEDRWRHTITVAAPVEAAAVFVPRAVTLEPLETPYYDLSGDLVTQFERIEPLWRPLNKYLPSENNAEPLLDVWYGETQHFGQNGTPQEWINILGNVEDPDGNELKSFFYTLNDGEPRNLSYGGDGSENDTHRLVNPGDFNIDIDKDDLRPLPATNEIVITAEDSVGVQKVFTGTVNYDASNVWPIPYEIDWSTAASIPEKAQIVDGKWGLSSDGVRILEPAYDRILAIGEGSFTNPGWEEFEVRTSVTVHGYSENGIQRLRPAIGVVARWQGHTDEPIVCEQPKCGYLPVGAASWYQWDNEAGNFRFSMWVNPANDQRTYDPQGLLMEVDKTYNWKVRVENSTGPEGMYYFWMWPSGGAEPGPDEYLISMAGVEGKSLESGSVLLVAHNFDVTFGDVQVCPLGGCPGPEISGVTAQPGITDATLTWMTDTSTTGRIEYWSDTNNVKTLTLDTLTTDHSVQLLNLEPETLYSYQIFAVDKFDVESSSAISTFTTEPVPPKTVTLQVTTAGTGSVTVDPQKMEYVIGEQVTLTAVPDGPKSYFAGWSLGASGIENPLVLMITGNTEIQAIFEQYQVGDFGYFLPMIRN